MEEVDLNRRVETSFGLIGFLATHVVDVDIAARRQSTVSAADLAEKLVKIRDFFSGNRQVVATDRFKDTFPVAVDTDSEKWASTLEEEARESQNSREGRMLTTGG